MVKADAARSGIITKLKTTTMNFDKPIFDLLNWQEERENERCYIYLAADADTRELNCHAGGGVTNLATSLAAMLLEVPALKKVLEGALGIAACTQLTDGKTVASEEDIRWEIRAAQEGESYREEQNL